MKYVDGSPLEALFSKEYYTAQKAALCWEPTASSTGAAKTAPQTGEAVNPEASAAQPSRREGFTGSKGKV